MADQVDDGCTADQCSLLTGMGVHVKNPFSSASSVAAAAQQQYFGKDFTCEVDAKKDQEACRCMSKDKQSQNGVRGQRQQKGVLMAVLLSGATLLLSTCSCVYVLQQSKVNTLEMEELRQTVQRLDALCARGATPFTPASQPRALSDSDTSPPASQHSADRPAMLHAYEPDVSDKNVEDAHDDANDYANGEDDRGGSSYAFFAAKSRQKRGSDSGRKGKKKRNGKSKMCKRLEKCVKAKETGKKVKGKCAKMLQCLPPPAPSTPAIKPVHFMGTFSKEERQKKFDRDSDSEGLVLAGEEAPLHFNAEADWMEQLYKDKSQQPILRLRDGGYKVTQSGVYFIYTSVMFHDIKPRQSQAVVVNGKKKLKCMDSVDYVNKTMTMNSQRKYKTCAISGLIHLNVNDRLEVQNLYAQTEIDQSEDATYFGALLLFPLELKSP